MFPPLKWTLLCKVYSAFWYINLQSVVCEFLWFIKWVVDIHCPISNQVGGNNKNLICCICWHLFSVNVMYSLSLWQYPLYGVLKWYFEAYPSHRFHHKTKQIGHPLNCLKDISFNVQINSGYLHSPRHSFQLAYATQVFRLVNKTF